MTNSLLVTGAGRGIGEAIARSAATVGYRVGVLDIDHAEAKRVAADLPNAIALCADVTDSSAVERALDAFGTPKVVVNNAGIVRFGPLLDLAVEDWRSAVDVNLTGTFIVASAAARRMAATVDQTQGAADNLGCIVNITSINGIAPGVNAGAYGPTKAAIALLTQQMSIEWGPLGIRVNSVAPGLIDGGMSAPIYADPTARQLRSQKVPAGRLGTVDDVAQAVLWLASDQASYVTGQQLAVDGGVINSIIANLPRPAAVDGVGTD